MRRPYGGETCIASLGKDKVGRAFPEHAERTLLRRSQPEGDGKIFRCDGANEFRTIDEEIRAAKGSDKPAFDPVRSHIGKFVSAFEFLHDGEVGHHVPCASAAGKEDTFHADSICPRAFFIDGRAGADGGKVKNSFADFMECGKNA